MRKAIKGIGLASILAVAGTSAAVAHPHHGTPPGCHKPLAIEILEGVELTPEQKIKVKAILDQGRPDPKNAPEIGKSDVTKLILAPSLDKDAIANKEADAVAHAQQRIKRDVDQALAVRAVLTPDQIKQGSARFDKIEALRSQIKAEEHPQQDHGPDVPEFP